jgi:hypothetical protein
MAEGFDGIIAQLERQKTAIGEALAALRDIEGTPANAAPSVPAKRRGRPPGASGKRSEGQRKRWAAKRVASVEAAAPAATPAKRKPNFTPEGRQKLADAMKKRWAVKRAAVKKGRKKAA